MLQLVKQCNHLEMRHHYCTSTEQPLSRLLLASSLLFQHIPSVKLNHLNVYYSMDFATAFAPGGLGQEEMVLSTMKLQRAPRRTDSHQCIALAVVVMELLSCADRP